MRAGGLSRESVLRIPSVSKRRLIVATPWGPGGLSRECVLRIPMRVLKSTKMGRRNMAKVDDTALSTNLT